MFYNLPLGIFFLLFFAIIIYSGYGKRFLQDISLNRLGCLTLVFCLLVGNFFSFPLSILERTVYINVGGSLIPLIFAAYLFIALGKAEKLRFGLTFLIVFIYSFTLFCGSFWRIGEYIPNYTFFMLALLGVCAAIFAGRFASAFCALFAGMVLAQSASVIFYRTIMETEIGGPSFLNSMILVILWTGCLLYGYKAFAHRWEVKKVFGHLINHRD